MSLRRKTTFKPASYLQHIFESVSFQIFYSLSDFHFSVSPFSKIKLEQKSSQTCCKPQTLEKRSGVKYGPYTDQPYPNSSCQGSEGSSSPSGESVSSTTSERPCASPEADQRVPAPAHAQQLENSSRCNPTVYQGTDLR